MVYTEKIPDYIKRVFKERGVDTQSIISVIYADLDKDGCYYDTYIALDKESLYSVSGIRKTLITDKKQVVDEFLVTCYEFILISEIKNVRVERHISTARLMIEKNDDSIISLCRFSFGRCFKFDKLCDYIIKVRDHISLENLTNEEVLELICPKCGLPYSDAARKICPNCMDKGSVVLRLFALVKDYKKEVSIILAFIIFSAILGIVSPYFSSKILYDEVLKAGGKYYGQILFVIIIIAGFRLFQALFSVVYGVIVARIMPSVIQKLRMQVFSALQHLSVSFFTSKQTGSLMSRVNDDTQEVHVLFVNILPNLIVNTITIISVVCILIFIKWYLAIIVIISTFLMVFLDWNYFLSIRKLFRKRRIANRNLSSVVSDSLNGQRVVKSFAKESQEKSRFFKRTESLYSLDLNINNRTTVAFSLIWEIFRVGIILVWLIGGLIIMHDPSKLKFGDIMAIITYGGALIGPLEGIMWSSDRIVRCIIAAAHVFEIIDSPPGMTEKPDAVKLDNIKGDIKLENIKFEYETGRPVIKGLNLDINGGKMFGIVGKTGAGKTTIIDLISRLYDVTEGSITIDGVNIKNLAFETIKKKIGVVSQDGYIFMGTIAENIAFSKPEATIEEIIEAAKIADAHEFIMKQKDGYETRIGEGGKALSGGEKQRISIARVILQNPSVLILDEATASMDTQTEARIMNAIDRLKDGRTIISIAHRLSTLRDADYLAVIENGKVVEKGTHDELINKKGQYFELYKIQSEAMKHITV